MQTVRISIFSLLKHYGNCSSKNLNIISPQKWVCTYTVRFLTTRRLQIYSSTQRQRWVWTRSSKQVLLVVSAPWSCGLLIIALRQTCYDPAEGKPWCSLKLKLPFSQLPTPTSNNDSSPQSVYLSHLARGHVGVRVDKRQCNEQIELNN